MENRTFCQSCSMPLDGKEMLGTERDASLNHEYCKYCYQNGAFINPEMTLDEMRAIVKTQMEKRKIDDSVTRMALNSLPNLKRWKGLRPQMAPVK